MTQVTRALESIGETVLLAVRTFRYVGTVPRQFHRLIEQAYLIGYATLPIVVILSFFIGSVLALQTGYSLKAFGAQDFIGAVVGLSMARELGPVMVSILLAGRVGSAVTAELASMQVYQEVDALRTMNIPPERILVLPRLIAILFMMPFLTIVGNVVGWLGGAVVANFVPIVGTDWDAFFQSLRSTLTVRDVVDGLIKAEIFGFFVILVACYIGLNTRGGPREIGHSVTRSVVVSLILILVLDYFVTRALL
jgi:phospholipid/cholesterol/gamma-HCH transport system permease protein